MSPHTLRHTTAMHLLRSGNEVNMVSYWLGHADINTTHLYVEIDMQMKRRMLEKAASPTVKRLGAWRRPGMLDWLNRLAKPRDYVQPIAKPTQNTKPTLHGSALAVT